MADESNNGPYARGAPDPTLLTREESLRLEERLRREVGQVTIRELVEEKISSLKELHQTTFNMLQEQLKRHQSDNKEAVNTAFSERKEAANKSEASTEKQFGAIDLRIRELKERLDTGEGAQRGSVDTRQERRSDVGSMVGLAALVISIINAIIIVITEISLPHISTSAPVVISAPAPAPAPAPAR